MRGSALAFPFLVVMNKVEKEKNPRISPGAPFMMRHHRSMIGSFAQRANRFLSPTQNLSFRPKLPLELPLKLVVASFRPQLPRFGTHDSFQLSGPHTIQT